MCTTTVVLCDSMTKTLTPFDLGIPHGKILGSLPFRLVGKHKSDALNQLASDTLDKEVEVWADIIHREICKQTNEDPESMSITGYQLMVTPDGTSGLLCIHIVDNDSKFPSSITAFI